jgi:hypothetical protein
MNSSLERGHDYLVNFVNVLKSNEHGKLTTRNHIDTIANDLRLTGCCIVKVIENKILKIYYNNRIVYINVYKCYDSLSLYEYPSDGELQRPLRIVKINP